MSFSFFRRGWLKRFWRDIHLWLGVGLFILLVPIGLSGATLVYHDDIEEFMRTPTGAVAPAQPTDLTAAIVNAKAAAGTGFQPVNIRIPDDARVPLGILLRGQARQGERPPFLMAVIDRHDSRVLKIADFRNTFFGFMHTFHENLTIPQFSGRDIVGWGGVAMLILALTGLYLWWPRRGQWSRAFAWRRAPATSSNLHYLAGFWICFPLALISLTGIYLAWPQQGRSVLSSMAPMTPQPPRGAGPGGGPLIPNPTHTPSDIFNIATALGRGQVDLIGFPNVQAGLWRVRLNAEDRTEPVTININDRSGAVTTIEPLSGDRVAFWIRWLHEGSHAGEIWRFVVFAAGITPTLLGVTGILIWLRQRRQRKMIKAGTRAKPVPAPKTVPAE